MLVPRARRVALGPGKYVWFDRVGLLAFVLLWFVLPLAWAPWPRVLAANVACSCVVSIYLFMIFVTNHVGMPVADARQSRLRRQVEHTRNLRVPAWLDFFFNGLSFHIEHHLFPRVPMHRLRACQPTVRAACQEHGIRYTEQRYGTALRESLSHLWRVGAQLGRRRAELRLAHPGRSCGGS